MDKETEAGLPNANLVLPDLNIGATTDESGLFNINRLPEGSHRLEVSVIGYKKHFSTVDLFGNEANIIVKLNIEPLIMDRLEVQGLLTSRLSTEKVEVIAGEEIAKREIQSLSELLESVPGVDVQTAYTFGRNVNVSIRGSSDYKPGGYNNRVLLLLDGFPILIPNSGGADWNAIPMNNIQRVEVLHGPASALYGQNSMGGVINLITHGSEASLVPSASFSFGSYGAKKLDASGGLSFGSLQAFGNISKISSDGHRFNANSDLLRFSGKLEHKKKNGTSLSMSTILTESLTGHPGFVAPQRPSLISYRLSTRSARYFQFNHRRKLNNRVSWNNSLAFHNFLTNYSDRDDTPLDEIEGKSKYNDLSATFRTEFFSMSSPSMIMIAGVEAGLDQSDVTVMNPIYGSPMQQQTAASFIQNRKSIGGGWSVVSGLRADIRVVNPGNDFTPRIFKALSPKVSVSYREGSRRLLNISVNKGFRAPSLSELYLLHASPYGLFLQGTPSLNPEKVWALDVGYRNERSSTFFWKTKLFHNRYSNMIDFVYAIPVKAKNWQSISASGAEIQLSKELKKNSHFLLNYSFLHMVDLEGKAPLLYRPKHKINGTFSFQRDNLIFALSGRFVSRQRYEDFLAHDYDVIDGRVIFPLMWLPSRFLANANFSLEFRSLVVSLKIENILNTKYELIQNYPMQGRSWMLKLSSNIIEKGVQSDQTYFN
tara:strand:+ start:4188 stop:6317 length:2130 start_codon:yes stop_codon:yes gene_type:complete